jgi:glyceraldehyde 3-phosphate dehydrogenase
MALRIAINGFGRIGRNVFRVIHQNHPSIEIVAINDITNTETLAHLLKYDSVHGPFRGSVKAGKDSIVVDGRNRAGQRGEGPGEAGPRREGRDIAIESTGVFTSRADCQKHLDAGAKRVILTVPPKTRSTPWSCWASTRSPSRPPTASSPTPRAPPTAWRPWPRCCTRTSASSRPSMTTIHSYTNDQNVLDLPHKDLRRARAAAINMIPTTTGAAQAVGLVLPELKGKLDGCSVRVPTPDVSVVDWSSAKRLPRHHRRRRQRRPQGRRRRPPTRASSATLTDPVVSSDMMRNSQQPASSTRESTKVLGKRNMVKIVTWYDNEWGYSCRVVDLALLLDKLPK